MPNRTESDQSNLDGLVPLFEKSVKHSLNFTFKYRLFTISSSNDAVVFQTRWLYADVILFVKLLNRICYFVVRMLRKFISVGRVHSAHVRETTNHHLRLSRTLLQVSLHFRNGLSQAWMTAVRWFRGQTLYLRTLFPFLQTFVFSDGIFLTSSCS